MSRYKQRIYDVIFHRVTADRRAESLGGIRLDRKALLPDVRRLSVPSSLRSAWAIAVQWAVIFGAIGVAVWSGHWAVYLLAMFVVATRQHALGILLHDAAHYRLFPGRRWNDLLTDIFVGFPANASTSLYRKLHVQHHRYVNTLGDPEVLGELHDPSTWRWPGTKRHLAMILVKDLSGLGAGRTLEIMNFWNPWSRLHLPSHHPGGFPVHEKVLLIVHTAVVVTVLTRFDLWLYYVLLWIVPSLTFTSFIFKIRSYGEHKAVPGEHELSDTRTTISNRLERMIFAPCNVNFHLEHHLFPSVPFYNLPKLHERLMREPEFRDHATIAASYLGAKDSVLEAITSGSSPRRAAGGGARDEGGARGVGSEAGSEAGSKAGSKAGSEAGSEVGSEAGSEARSDAGSEAGSEARSEASSEQRHRAASPAVEGMGPGSLRLGVSRSSGVTAV